MSSPLSLALPIPEPRAAAWEDFGARRNRGYDGITATTVTLKGNRWRRLTRCRTARRGMRGGFYSPPTTFMDQVQVFQPLLLPSPASRCIFPDADCRLPQLLIDAMVDWCSSGQQQVATASGVCAPLSWPYKWESLSS